LNNYRVLVIGPRRALIDVLRARDIPFSVWREAAGPPIADARQIVTAPLWNTTAKLKQLIGESFASAHFTHVIAGTEAAVYPAAVARRVLGARLSPATTALRCRDKLAMKEYLSDFDIPMTDFMAESSARSAAEAFARLGTPLVRKHRKSSGGRGLELIHREQDLVLRRDGRNILERFVAAPEASIESFVKDSRIEFVNTTRYLEKGHVNFVPSALDDALLESMQALNRRVNLVNTSTSLAVSPHTAAWKYFIPAPGRSRRYAVKNWSGITLQRASSASRSSPGTSSASGKAPDRIPATCYTPAKHPPSALPCTAISESISPSRCNDLYPGPGTSNQSPLTR
jgi:hypothetical protein